LDGQQQGDLSEAPIPPNGTDRGANGTLPTCFTSSSLRSASSPALRPSGQNRNTAEGPPTHGAYFLLLERVATVDPRFVLPPEPTRLDHSAQEIQVLRLIRR